MLDKDPAPSQDSAPLNTELLNLIPKTLLNLVYPPICLACDAVVEAGHLCESCQQLCLQEDDCVAVDFK